jgi:hypothetical protein
VKSHAEKVANEHADERANGEESDAKDRHRPTLPGPSGRTRLVDKTTIKTPP